MRNASVVPALPTVHDTSRHPLSSSSCKRGSHLRSGKLQQAVARMALEDLRQQVSRARPTQEAPPAGIAGLAQATRLVTSPTDELHGRPDGQSHVTVDTLHQHVLAMLHQFD